MSKYSNDAMRKEALTYILWARQRRPTQVRTFRYPSEDELNFEADTIWELLDFKEIEAGNPSYITEPPLLMEYSDNELVDIYQASVEGVQPLDYICDEKVWDEKKIRLGKNQNSIKCHAMDNECAVQQTTKACKKNIGHDNQAGAIIVTKDSVDQLPITSNKSEICKRLDFK